MKALRGGFSMSLVLKFLKAEDGATAIEYGLIAALIAGSSLPA
jgi:Flp pilus assembly pilin Flp